MNMTEKLAEMRASFVEKLGQYSEKSSLIKCFDACLSDLSSINLTLLEENLEDRINFLRAIFPAWYSPSVRIWLNKLEEAKTEIYGFKKFLHFVVD